MYRYLHKLIAGDFRVVRLYSFYRPSGRGGWRGGGGLLIILEGDILYPSDSIDLYLLHRHSLIPHKMDPDLYIYYSNTSMTGPGCANICNLINAHTYLS